MDDQPVTLQSPGGQATARLLPQAGFNLFQLHVSATPAPLDLLWSEEHFEQGGRRPSGSGIPLLFPFPGRLAGTTFAWKGETYQLTAGDGRGNAIHGFVLDRPWRVLEQSQSHIVGQFHASQDAPELQLQWPADFRITARYDLDDQQLRGNFTLENPADRDLPCGFGIHPYFRLPLGGPQAADCRVLLPVRSEWQLHEMLPTGQWHPLPDPAAVQKGQAFADLRLDNVYRDLVLDEQRTCRAQIIDPHSRRQLSIEFNDVFRECVVYTPPHREAICIEPYTCLPGAFHLIDQGVDTGIRVLPPGESFQAEMAIRWTS